MLAPSYTFYVPETIYLAPSTSATKTFKYYVDRENSVNSSLRKGENTSGNIYFKCDKASSIKSLTLSDCSSVSIGATTSSSGTLSTTVSAGSLSAGLNPGEKKLLTWTVVYVADGVEYTANAYTVAYAPWPTVVSASSQGRNKHSGDKRSYIMQTTGFRVFIRLLITEAVLMEAVFINTALSFRHHLFQQVLIVIWVICLTRAQEEADFGKQTRMQRVTEDEVLSSLILADTHIIIKFPI